jgi:hypothetical protein
MLRLGGQGCRPFQCRVPATGSQAFPVPAAREFPPAPRWLGHICGQFGREVAGQGRKAGIPCISHPRLIQGLLATVAVAGNQLPGLALKVLGATNRVSI